MRPEIEWVASTRFGSSSFSKADDQGYQLQPEPNRDGARLRRLAVALA